MGLFSSRTPDPVPEPEPAHGKTQPVSRARVEKYLRSHDYNFRIDEDGDIFGIWDSNYFYFLFYGDNKEILQVRGRYRQGLPPERGEELMLFINDWNRDHYWPKTYYFDEGDLQVCAEVTTDLEPGVTDTQLSQLLDCGLFTGLQFFKEMDARFATADEGTDLPPAD